MRKAVIVSAVRTALGNYNGSLRAMGATDLGSIVITEAVKRAGVDKKEVDEVIMGHVLPCGYGQNPARLASIKAGLPVEVQCLTINKVCGSGLKAVMLAAQAIQLGDADVVVAGGMESMTNAPYYLEKARFGYHMGNGQLIDSMVHDGLWDIVNDFHMGMSNELCSQKYDVNREDQDRYASQSYHRTLTAIREGKFIDEIATVKIPQQKGEMKEFKVDECPRETSFETLSKMKPVFKKDGCGTAGNSSIISDGAAAVVVMAREKAESLGCEIMATLGSQASHGIDLKYLLVAPILAIPKVLKKEGLAIKDVDLFEINEAFSGSSLAIMRELDLDPDKINVNGGGVALGHPLGASGCRVLVTLLYEMIRRQSQVGLATLCLGGGEAAALIVKR
jgi:acetyl-CoA C-acetyltransferase